MSITILYVLTRSHIGTFAVYFYNFGMQDFGVSSLVSMIDGVKVLAFAVREGRVAVHCHAGLGRTGRNTNSVSAVHINTVCQRPCDALMYTKCVLADKQVS